MVAFANGYAHPDPPDQPNWESLFQRRAGVTPTVNFSALGKAIEASWRGMQPFRELNRNLVREYTGPAYGEMGGKRKYLNKIRQAIDAWTMLLAANRPRAEVTSPNDNLRPFSNHFTVAVNNLITEIGLEYTIRAWVLDAFFLVGIIKVHQKESAAVQFESDLWMDPGTPFASNISIDNFVCDMGAAKASEWKWAADAYRIPMSDIQKGVEIGLYDPEVAAEIKPASKFHATGERLEEFSRGNLLDNDDFEPMVDLCDVWVKRERKIYTFPITERGSFRIGAKPLAVMDWLDAEMSPYHLLGFNDVPENVMPLSPASDLDELDRLLNNLWRKLARQAMRQKQVTVVSSAGVDTGKKFQREIDGGMITGDPSAVASIQNSGADPSNQAFAENVRMNLDNQAGNITSLLGLGAQAETLGQEQLIRDAGNRKVGQMQYRVLDATRKLLRGLGLLLWYDEFKEITATIEQEGTDYVIPSDLASWKPGDREGNFLDYNFNVNIYSMAYRPPAMQAETVTSLLTTVFIPMQQLMMAQGGTIDFAKLAERYAGLLDIEWLKDVITFSNPVPSEDQPELSSGKSPVSTRNYVRRNVPTGGTDQSRSGILQQLLRGQAVSPQQGASMSMPAA